MISFEQPKVIAEIADAHYGSLERAKQMAFLAKEAGCDYAKFQHHLPEFEMLQDIPMSANMREPLYDFLKRNALTIEEHIALKNYCDFIGIEYLCTPFSREAALELETHVNPSLYKIGSGELTDLPTLGKIAEFHKPMIVSTGMAAVSEIDETYNFLVDQIPQIVLMNCTSAYPPKASDIFLSFIPKMKERYPRAIIGHSDHMPTIYTSLGAVALGAMLIEKHVTIDSKLEGPDDSVSITFDEMEKLVKGVKEIFEGLNSDKRLLESEMPIQQWARRSLVYLRDLPAGSILSRDDVWGKRPGTGVPAKFYEQVVGKTLRSAVKKDTLVNQEDFEA